jgi:serine/threonine protein kinase
MDNHYILINGHYILGKPLGIGSFGEIFLGIDKNLSSNDPNKLVAIKLETRKEPIQLLKFEASVYRHLYRENKGIPKLFWSGVQDDFNVMVIEMLGPNLENLFNLSSRLFSLKTTIILAQEMIQRIQYVHSRGIIHRDIKPENFLIGLNTNQLYIIDFGLCKLFKNNDNSHIPPSNNKKLVGTIRYASINSHSALELSRRDDLESIGYMLIYFLKGKLPWQGLGQKHMKREEKYQMIYECKKNTTIEQLCQGLPIEFKLYMEHIRSLEFAEKPNYNYLYNLFAQLFKKNKFIYDDIFDWNLVKVNKLISK